MGPSWNLFVYFRLFGRTMTEQLSSQRELGSSEQKSATPTTITALKLEKHNKPGELSKLRLVFITPCKLYKELFSCDDLIDFYDPKNSFQKRKKFGCAPGPNPIKVFSASIEATLKFQPMREPKTGRMTALIVWNFSVASIDAEKSFIGSGPELQVLALAIMIHIWPGMTRGFRVKKALIHYVITSL